MIETLRIRGLGVIDEAEIGLHPGLTVLTGETGAGKTMVLTGLGLVLGDRADPSRVRPGAGRTVIEAVVALAEPTGMSERARHLVGDAGGQLDEDGTLVLLRTVSAQGRSRAHAGGTAVPAATLTALRDALVTIHGQADQRRLLQPGVQRELLDAFAAQDPEGSKRSPDPGGSAGGAHPPHHRLVTDHREVFQQLVRAREDLAALRRASADRAREQEMLRHGMSEIGEIDPRPDEDAELAAEQARLGAAQQLTRAANTARAALAGEEDMTGGDIGGAGGSVAVLIAAAARAVGDVASLDPALRRLAERMNGLGVDADDIASDLASYAATVEQDPVRLAMIGERRESLSRLARRYGTGSGAGDPVLAWAETARGRLMELDGAEDRATELEADCTRLQDTVAATATRLTAARVEAAERLAVAVNAELADLAMPAARLVVTVAPRTGPGTLVLAPPGLPPRTVGSSGADQVAISLVPHAGAGAVPLGSGISGGELSRVMLAVEVVLAGGSGTPTFVFDEVDAGIGGRTAVQVGRRLARLARTRQVVVVTHLAQVAAYADRHLVVVRDESGTVTTSGVVPVAGPARVGELARMLSGDPDAPAARAIGQQLLDAARDPARTRRVGPRSPTPGVAASIDATVAPAGPDGRGGHRGGTDRPPHQEPDQAPAPG